MLRNTLNFSFTIFQVENFRWNRNFVLHYTNIGTFRTFALAKVRATLLWLIWLAFSASMLNIESPSSLSWDIWLRKKFLISFSLLKDRSAVAVVTGNDKKINIAARTLGNDDATELYVIYNTLTKSRIVITITGLITFLLVTGFQMKPSTHLVFIYDVT